MLEQKGVLRRDFTAEANSESTGVVVIGDVHGCADALKQVVEQIKGLPYSPTVVFVGDLLDRGEQGPEVWDLVRRMYYAPSSFNAKEVVVVKGNHEQLLVDAYYSQDNKEFEYRLWKRNGGVDGDMQYISEYSTGSHEIKWVESLSPFYIHPEKVIFNSKALNLIVTHGCVLPKKWFPEVDKQDPQYLFWERYVTGYDEDWLTIHGHTIQNKEPTLLSTSTGQVMLIDTGSFLTGVVTGVEFIDLVK
jgi:serine/threonine protein phosphatase 1